MVNTNVGTGLEERLNSLKISPKTGLILVSSILAIGLAYELLSDGDVPTFNMYEPPSSEYRIEGPIDSGISTEYVIPDSYQPFSNN